MNEMQKDFLRKPKIVRKYNAKEFFEFTKDKDYKKERYELIDGEIYMMAMPAVNHQEIAGYIYRKLGNYLEGKTCRAFLPLDVVLFEKGDRSKEKNNARNVFEPDVFVVCDPKKIGEKRIYGAPDFVVEVVSPGNSMNDYVSKLNGYMTYGVKEYWIVNPLTKKINVYIKDKKDLTTQTYTLDDKIKVSIFDDFYIDFKELQNLI